MEANCNELSEVRYMSQAWGRHKQDSSVPYHKIHVKGKVSLEIKKLQGPIQWKLDGVGPVDNRPSTD